MYLLLFGTINCEPRHFRQDSARRLVVDHGENWFPSNWPITCPGEAFGLFGHPNRLGNNLHTTYL